MARKWTPLVAVALAALLVVAYQPPAAAQAPGPSIVVYRWIIFMTYEYRDTTNKLLPWQDSYVNGSITAIVQTLPRRYNISASDVAIKDVTTNTTTTAETAVAIYNITTPPSFTEIEPLSQDLLSMGDSGNPLNDMFTKNLVKNGVPVTSVSWNARIVYEIPLYSPPPPPQPPPPSAGTRASASFAAWLVVSAGVFLSVAGALSVPL